MLVVVVVAVVICLLFIYLILSPLALVEGRIKGGCSQIPAALIACRQVFVPDDRQEKFSVLTVFLE